MWKVWDYKGICEVLIGNVRKGWMNEMGEIRESVGMIRD